MGFIALITPGWSLLNFLAFICGTLWTFTYIYCIWNGIKNRACYMPIEALAFNFAWEILFGIVWFCLEPGTNLQMYVNILWGLFDIGILYTFFRYGTTRGVSHQRFKLYGLGCLIFGFAILGTGFWYDYPHIENLHAVSAWLVNGIMSVIFIRLLWARGGPSGQSLWIAWGKGLGTFAVTLAYTRAANLNMIEDINYPVIIATGWICFAFDLTYIYLLSRALKRKD